MDGARTRGHGPALAAVAAMVRGPAPHAVLLSGPGGVGKTTLALDLAAGLLCTADDPPSRPCRSCRGCRLVDHDAHPDLHRLTPSGPGGQIVIGKAEDGTGVRGLISALSLLPLEGGARVAIIEAAHQLNEDAQGALLKTLEEPPAGVTIVLCTDDEARLLETIRSRCARIRLGPVDGRAIETILVERGAADAPTAARLGRLADGRPGVALAYAQAPTALPIRDELVRVVIDLADRGIAERLAAMREAFPRALALVAALEAGARPAAASKPRRSAKAAAASPPSAGAPEAAVVPETTDSEGPEAIDPDAPARAIPPAQRRRAAETLVAIAIEVARDLALVAAGGERSVHDPVLLEELVAVAAGLDPGGAVAALTRAERAAELIAANVNPELIVDDLALAWPRRRRAA